ncbi:hypothetical protein KFL_001400220 [Klebsormidium nitens]|uniref:F-box domain-containing protein n=1 Tax=Klebsormidium nitens TaxID=105231 RepID=A0A1Y1I542_KLENI|nr:hypothetical protein KFL_001400220 [Klebsormidium nitens]|eukprot:GAQ83238.1 hypothetical protein KFL_001400220 [Klebsormidium nitens]
MVLGAAAMGAVLPVMAMPALCALWAQMLVMLPVGFGMALMGDPTFPRLVSALKLTGSEDEAVAVVLYDGLYSGGMIMGPFVGLSLKNATSSATVLQILSGCLALMISAIYCGTESTFGGAQPRSSLPGDVLRIILNKIGLKDRLRLELLSKSHRDTLREPELWRELNLASMQALDLSDDQLLHLLSRTNSGLLEKLSSQVYAMAEILEELTQAESFIKRPFNECLNRLPMAVEVGPHRANILFPLTAILFSFLYRVVPASWGPTRAIVETCTTWFSDQVNRVIRIFPRILRLIAACQANIKHPSAFKRTLLASFNGPPSVRLAQVDSAKVAVFLNASGAADLSPAFIAACIVALSAAGFKTEFRMEGNMDPLFSLHLVSLIQALAVDCSVRVNLLVSGAHFGPNLKHFLKNFNSWLGDQEGGSEHDVAASLSSSLAAFRSSVYPDSSAAYQRFEQKFFVLAKLRTEVEAIAGRAYTRGAKAKVLSQSVVIENLLNGVDQHLLRDELQEYLSASPSKLRLVLRNCRLSNANIVSLCDMLGERGVGHVTFQQTGFMRPRFRLGNSVLSSLGLRNSKDLQILELDCRLRQSDFHALTAFLDANEPGAKIQIHMRRSFYCLDLRKARGVLSKLKALCSSERGARVRVVQHPGGAPGGSLDQATDSVSTFDNSPFEREVATAIKYELLLKGIYLTIDVLQLFDQLSCLLYVFQRMLLGQAKPLTSLWGAGFVLESMWRPVHSLLQGESHVLAASATSLFYAALFPWYRILVQYAVEACVAYLWACLVWTALKQLARLPGAALTRR